MQARNSTVPREKSDFVPKIPRSDRAFIDRCRGISIGRVVLGHLGLFWIYPPYSAFLHSLLPLLFFVSGAVTYFSYLRAPSTGQYLWRRLITILVPWYGLALIANPVAWIYRGEWPQFDTAAVVGWITLDPPNSSTPFPLGQVWFLHALALIVVVSPIIFRAVKRGGIWPLLFIGVPIGISFLQLFYDLSGPMTVMGHNTYQAVANMGFFALGAVMYSRTENRSQAVAIAVFVLSVIAACAAVVFLDLEINLGEHSYAPDFYYLACGFAATSMMVLLKNPLAELCRRAAVIEWLLMYVSRHSYAFFLLHSLFILLAEDWFGLVGVASDPLRALSKVLFVLICTALTAPLFTAFWKNLVKRIPV